MDERELKTFSRNLIVMNRKLQIFRSLIKTEGGHLTPAGKAILQQGLGAGMQKSRIAHLLEISPAAVTYRAR
jgi:hypothetical protein